jgi:DNA-binding NtrC family response regulator
MADTVLITTQDLEPAVRLRDAFRAAGFDTELLTPGEHVGDVREPVLLVLTGSLDEKQSRRLVREAAEHDGLPVIGLFEQESAPTITTELKTRLGIHEAFTKPVDPAEVVLTARRLMDRTRLRRITGIVGETDAMIETLERVVQIAPVSSTVLLTGESGTGKERVARGIHALSQRRHRPFIATNVAALPETLLEAELFGHEKGAFTGAIGQRKGFFELAHRGTMFLDEIGEMPMATQTKLLRALEEQSFRRLGGETEIQVDVRVIAATNQPLRQLVELNRFRRDLYFRLNVLHIELPPLRERRADIPLLIDGLIRQRVHAPARPAAVIVSPEAMAILIGRDVARQRARVQEPRRVDDRALPGAGDSAGGYAAGDPDARDPSRTRTRSCPSRAMMTARRHENVAGTRVHLQDHGSATHRCRGPAPSVRRLSQHRPEAQAALPHGYALRRPVHCGFDRTRFAAAGPAAYPPRVHDRGHRREPTRRGSPPNATSSCSVPGMTLADLEKNAITSRLRQVVRQPPQGRRDARHGRAHAVQEDQGV